MEEKPMRTKTFLTVCTFFSLSLLLSLTLPASPAHTTPINDHLTRDLTGWQSRIAPNLSDLDWYTLPGPTGGSISHILLTPDHQWDSPIFAGVQGHGVYRSQNDGFSWAATGSDDWIMVDLVMSPAFAEDETLLALTGTGQTGYTVQRTQDGGQNWQALGSYPGGMALVMSPAFAQDQTVYLLTGSDNLTYRSTDGAVTFTPLGNWWAGHNVNALAFSPDFAQDQTLFALAVSDGLYRSIDGGTTWTLAGLSGSFSALAVSPNFAQDEMLLVIDADGNLYLSHDAGDNWEPVIGITLDSSGRFSIAFSPTFAGDGVIMIASSADPGPYRSLDSGQSWATAGWYDPAHDYQDGLIGGGVQDLALAPNQDWSGIAYAATRAGVARSPYGGSSWNQRNKDLPRPAVRTLAHAPGQPQIWLAGTAYFEQVRFDSGTLLPDAGAIHYSYDSGQTWRQVSGRLPRLNAVAFSPNFAQDQTAFAAAGMIGQHGFVEGGLYRSTDGGKHWTAVTPAATAFTTLAVSPNYASNQTVWASGLNGLYRSTNGGTSWSLIAPGFVNMAELAVSPNYARDQTIFAATSGDGVQRATDGGFIWAKVLDTPLVTALAISPVYGAGQTVYAAARTGAGAPTTLYRSSNGGQNWQPLDGAIPPEQNGQPLTISSLAFAVDGSVLAGAQYGTNTAVYRSSDGGSTWASLPDLDATAVYDLTTLPGHSFDLYAATDSGLHRLTLPQGGPAEPGTWHSSGPYAGMARALAVSPNFAQDGSAFAGDYVTDYQFGAWGLGVRQSTDYGRSWQDASAGMAGYDYSSALLDYAFSPDFTADQTVFAATWGGLFRSDNGGEYWARLQTPLGIPDLISRVVVAPDFDSSGHLMITGGFYSTLLISEDGGQSWRSPEMTGPEVGTNNQPLMEQTNDMVYSPNFAGDQTLFVTGIGGLFRSTDGGHTWAELLGHYFATMAVSPNFAQDQTLWGGIDEVYRSQDGGHSWQLFPIAADASIHKLIPSPTYAQDQTLFAGTSKGLFWSDDGGESWTAVAEFSGQSILNLALSPQWPDHPLLLVGTINGVSRLHTADWPEMVAEAGRGLAPIQGSVWAKTADDSLLLVGSSGHGIYASQDQGQNWQPYGMQEYSHYQVAALALSPNYAGDQTVFAAHNNMLGMGGSIFRTQDGGATWTWLHSDQYINALAVSPDYANDGTILAAAGGNLVYTNDQGDTWQTMAGWSPYQHGSAGQIRLLPSYAADGRIFVGSSSGFWFSQDNGQSWTQASSSLIGKQVYALQLSPNFDNDGTLLAVAGWSEPGIYRQAVFRSTNGGVDWTEVMAGIPAGISDAARPVDVAFSPHFASDQTAYAITARGLYRSLNGGQSWIDVGRPAADVRLRRLLATSDGRIFASSSAGVWRYHTLYYNLIVNGRFEGTGGWSHPITPAPAQYSSRVVYNGHTALRLGLDNDSNVYAYSSARQTITLPASALHISLTFHLYPVSGEATLAAPSALMPQSRWLEPEPVTVGDAQFVLLIDPDTADILEIVHWSLSNGQAWRQHTVALPLAYAGRSLLLHFGVYNDGANGRTALYVDDVSLMVMDGALVPNRLYLPIILENYTASTACKSGKNGFTVPSTQPCSVPGARAQPSHAPDMRTCKLRPSKDTISIAPP
jgi:photosystem II stability/assembly factor-like uncharacterized protein